MSALTRTMKRRRARRNRKTMRRKSSQRKHKTRSRKSRSNIRKLRGGFQDLHPLFGGKFHAGFEINISKLEVDRTYLLPYSYFYNRYHINKYNRDDVSLDKLFISTSQLSGDFPEKDVPCLIKNIEIKKQEPDSDYDDDDFLPLTYKLEFEYMDDDGTKKNFTYVFICKEHFGDDEPRYINGGMKKDGVYKFRRFNEDIDKFYSDITPDAITDREAENKIEEEKYSNYKKDKQMKKQQADEYLEKYRKTEEERELQNQESRRRWAAKEMAENERRIHEHKIKLKEATEREIAADRLSMSDTTFFRKYGYHK